MDQEMDFNDLIILDLANNHSGDVEHGLNIIRSFAEVVRSHKVRAALKFQFRQLDTFIHPAHQQGSDHKQVQRFLSTKLPGNQFQTLLDEVRKQGLVSMCTPFDEESVDVISDMDFDIIKVASCSGRDWPLLEKVADAGKPVIFSTGGLSLQDIDNLVSFFKHRGVHFAIMHCVAIYPTPDDKMNLNQIGVLRGRYPGVHIGWSTHEDPADTTIVQMAVALGATLYERHVGIPTEKSPLNAYSSSPQQASAWIAAKCRARILCGAKERPSASEAEVSAIEGLKRGVYAKTKIRKGTIIDPAQVYFAIPYLEGQLDSGKFKPGTLSANDVAADAPIFEAQVTLPQAKDELILKHAVHEVKAMLNEAKIHLGPEFKVEYSHHYGIRNFRETGAVLIECVNRDYCKKLVVQLPGQKHPSHYHDKKEETFQVLHGVLHCTVDGIQRVLEPGESVVVLPGVWHSFGTDVGVIFEEISTKDHNGDSYYEDKNINKLSREERKTVVDHWGRFQLKPQARTASPQATD
ncbi:MAG: N-acetylneuraminate synthase family protein [Desulfuromusa sp.]|nr:N-acetylneuraminate synthase family protein [Desulfuromusa sp.]